MSRGVPERVGGGRVGGRLGEEGPGALLRAGWRLQGDLLGPFEMLVLLALVRLGSEVSGAQVRRHIEHWTGRELAEASVYTTLGRLHAKGMVRSWRRAAVGGRWAVDNRPGPRERNARRFFEAETLGVRALRRSLRALDALRAGLRGMGLEEREWSRTEWGVPEQEPGVVQRRRCRSQRADARRARREGRRRRERLLECLRSCGHDVDWDGKVRRIDGRESADAQRELLEVWGFAVRPRRWEGERRRPYDWLSPMARWRHEAGLRARGWGPAAELWERRAELGGCRVTACPTWAGPS